MRNRDDPPSTYHQMVGIDDPLPQGRFRGVEPRHHVGKAPIEAPPRISHGPWAVPDGLGPEPALGVAIDALPDEEPPQPSPSPAVGGANEPATERSNATAFGAARSLTRRA